MSPDLGVCIVSPNTWIYINKSTYLERCIHLSGNPIYFGILHFEAAYHSLIQAIHFAASISEPIQKHSYQHIIQHLILYRHRYKRYTLLYRFVSGVIQVIILICNILSTILYRFRREHRARVKTIQAVSLFLEHAAWSTRSPLLCSDASVVFPRSSTPYLSRLTGSVEPTHEGH